MDYCKYCGAEIQDEKFCSACGMKVKKSLFKKKVKVVPNLIVLLDESGSMWSYVDQTIESINDLIKEQQKDKSPATLTVHAFDDEFRTSLDGVNLHSIKEFNDYKPNGGTALYDAVAKTITLAIEKFGEKSKTIIAIITDGGENCSKEVSQDAVIKLVDRCRKKYKWKFMFLSEGIDAKEGEHIAKSVGAYDPAYFFAQGSQDSGLKYRAVSASFSNARSSHKYTNTTNTADEDNE